MSSHMVVVGIDGSPQSMAAADWAALEARRTGRPLRLVHAWHPRPPTPTTPSTPNPATAGWRTG